VIKVRTALREQVQNTKSRIYQDIEDPSLIYIFGEWPTLQAHQDFTGSSLKDEILSLQGNQTQFKWMIHIEVTGGIEALPFASRVMTVSRLQGLDRDLVEKANVLEGCENALCAWRIDSEEGAWERLVLSGWESQDEHIAFVRRHPMPVDAVKEDVNDVVMYAMDMEK
jgi:heme-degrading monooxygenase HmoA